MNTNHIWAIARKDLREALGNTSVVLAMIIIPLVFIVILPGVLLFVAQSSGAQALNDPDLQIFFERMPAGMAAALAGMDELQRMVTIMLGYFFAPMFLIIPLMFSTTIAAESFAGERERKTMEALLYSPATDRELFLGKVTAGLLPSVALTWISFVLYGVVVNALGFPIFGRIWFPLSTWWPLIFWVTPALAVLGVSMTVLISSRVKTFMAAYQTSASSVVLVIGLLIGQVTGVLYLSIAAGLIIGLVLWLIGLLLLVLAIRSFNRKALLASA